MPVTGLPMTDLPRDLERFLTRLPHDSWAVALAAALFVFLVAGVLPRMTW
jgi:hypothetical protein